MLGSIVRTFTDPYDYQSFSPNAERKIVVTVPGKYEAESAAINLHRLLTERAWQSLPTISHSATRAGRVTFSIQPDVNRPPAIFGGTEVRPDEIIVRPSGTEHYCRAPAHMQRGSLSLAADEFAAVARTVIGRDLIAPTDPYVMRPQPAPMSHLLSLHKVVNDLVVTAPDILTQAEVAKAIEQEMLRAMIYCVTAPAATDRLRPARQSVMRRFEQVIEAHVDEPLYITDICAAVGVSERLLRAICHEHMAVSPHKYLWLRRMHLVRHALTAADNTQRP